MFGRRKAVKRINRRVDWTLEQLRYRDEEVWRELEQLGKRIGEMEAQLEQLAAQTRLVKDTLEHHNLKSYNYPTVKDTTQAVQALYRKLNLKTVQVDPVEARPVKDDDYYA